jgi:hypothetical protein
LKKSCRSVKTKSQQLQIADSSSMKAVSFIRTHNETLSVAAMFVSNPDCAPFVVQR